MDTVNTFASNLFQTTSVSGKDSEENTLSLGKSLIPTGTCYVYVTLAGKLDNSMSATARMYYTIHPTTKEEVKSMGLKKITDPKTIALLEKLKKSNGINEPLTKEYVERLKKKHKI